MIEKIVLIADSGATKTDWLINDFENEIRTVQTIGFNPYYVDSKVIYDELTKNLYPYIDNNIVEEVHFYGAGCSNSMNCMVVKNALEDFFPEAKTISVEHDLLGSARALLGNDKGISCILGTGSNSCLYDGNQIIENVPSLGFFLADEGSGAYMGKLLIRDYFFGDLPPEIKEAFDARYYTNLEKVLDEVYNKPRPNRYVASFTHFLQDHISNKHLRELVKKAFNDYFDVQICRYTDYNKVPMSAVGSIVYHFEEIFREVANEHGIKVDQILKSPLEGLINYHFNNKL